MAVFDGVQHPIKGREGRKRIDGARKNLEDIEAIWEKGDPEDLKELHKLKKRSGRVRAGIVYEVVDYLRSQGVKCVGAPFEAEWQCVHMETVGLADGILSIDSDNVPLGGKCVVAKFGWNAVNNKRARVASVLVRDEVMERVRQRLEWPDVNDEGLRALCVFMGCDYHLKIYGNGLAANAADAKHFQSLPPLQSKFCHYVIRTFSNSCSCTQERLGLPALTTRSQRRACT